MTTLIDVINEAMGVAAIYYLNECSARQSIP